ncbi:uncharacterized protein BDV14DRAFT_199409 [Aspergillus stella-maris]|uniref:uncharacterized protein n=1 Tax=Aspergillus stella-maris TaxID=1810926 RepID=UPI003CCD8DC2
MEMMDRTEAPPKLIRFGQFETLLKAETRPFVYRPRGVRGCEEERGGEHGLHRLIDAIEYLANALWPYRFITSVWQALVDSYPSRLSIETNTPVTEVVYCTNGYTGHPLPQLRRLMWPVCVTVTVLDIAGSPNRGAQNSWALVQKPQMDKNAMTTSLLYLQQNALSGHWLIGGGFSTLHETLTGDDTDTDPRSATYLQGKMCELIGASKSAERTKMVSVWTGVQGMTSDHSPLIRSLPQSVTGRAPNGE